MIANNQDYNIFYNKIIKQIFNNEKIKSLYTAIQFMNILIIFHKKYPIVLIINNYNNAFYAKFCIISNLINDDLEIRDLYPLLVYKCNDNNNYILENLLLNIKIENINNYNTYLVNNYNHISYGRSSINNMNELLDRILSKGINSLSITSNEIHDNFNGGVLYNVINN